MQQSHIFPFENLNQPSSLDVPDLDEFGRKEKDVWTIVGIRTRRNFPPYVSGFAAGRAMFCDVAANIFNQGRSSQPEGYQRQSRDTLSYTINISPESARTRPSGFAASMRDLSSATAGSDDADAMSGIITAVDFTWL